METEKPWLESSLRLDSNALLRLAASVIAVLVLLSGCASQGQTHVPGDPRTDSHGGIINEGPVGTWLVEPLYFDLIVDQGLVTPDFPVLVIRPNGEFKLFRISPYCVPHEPDGQEIDPARKPGRFLEACSEHRVQIREDGFRYSYGHLSASGRWELREASLRFTIDTTGATPEYFQRLVEAARDNLRSTADTIRQYARDQQTQSALQTVLVSTQTRLSTFYTSFYIFDGQPQSYSLEPPFMRLTGSDARDAIVYRAYSPEVVDATVAILAALDASASLYFRCLLDRVERAYHGGGTSPADFAALLDYSWKYTEFLPRLELSRAFRRVSGSHEAELNWTREDQERYERWKTTTSTHPAMLAARAGHLGAYLGCPQRDRQ